jgi:hypothetical protein
MKKMILNLFWLFSIVVIVVISAAKALNPHRIFRSSSSSKKRSLQSQSSFSTSIAKLTASNGGIGDWFGGYNQVSISNNRIVVGADGYDSRKGAVYLFGDSRNPQSGRSYSQLAFLTAIDGESGDWFGNSVAMDGDMIVVGAIYAANSTGAAYVYQIITDENNNFVSISQLAKLTPSNGVSNDEFGSSVAIRGKYILVGAERVDKNDFVAVGSAYLFGNLSNDPNSPEWTELQQFQPNDLTEYDHFGYSVAMDENIAVIGTYDLDANAAYVFAPVDSSSSSSLSTSWTLTAKLTGSTNSYFGYSVAVTGNWIVVGAPHDDSNTNGSNAGAVFVFTKTSSSSTWTQMTQLLASDGAADDWFGRSVSISKDASTIVVGAYYVNFNSNITDSGAAYMFRNINSTTTTTTTTSTVEWTQMGKFVAADRNTNDNLGSSIAMENNIVVVGAWGDDSDTGSVYVVDTGFASSTPATTAPPTTAQPTTVPTTVPTSTPVTPEPTMPPSSDNDSSSTPPLPTITNSPTTAVPLPPTTTTTTPTPSNIDTDPTNSPIPNNNTTTQPPVAEQSDNESNVIVTAIVVVGVVVTVLGSVLAFFNYRTKRDAREQQQQQALIPSPPPPPPPSSSNIPAVENTAAAAADEEEPTTPIMADAVVLVVPPPAQEVRDETLRAAAFLDPATVAAAAAKTSAAAAAAAVTNPSEKELPRYKDQVRAVQPPGPSDTNSRSSPKRNHQIHDPDDFPQQNRYPKEEEKEEEKEQSLEDQPPAVRPQQQPQQQLHRDPPANRHPPSNQDRVDL